MTTQPSLPDPIASPFTYAYYHQITTLGSGTFSHTTKHKHSVSQREITVRTHRFGEDREKELAYKDLQCKNLLIIWGTYLPPPQWNHRQALTAEPIDGYISDISGKHWSNNIEALLELLTQMATGIEYLHQQKITHRHLQPNNTAYQIIPKSGYIKSACPTPGQLLYKLSEYGLTRELTRGEIHWGPYNAFFYSPELHRRFNICRQSLLKQKQSYTSAVDIFALGRITLYLIRGEIFFLHPHHFQQQRQATKTEMTKHLIKHPNKSLLSLMVQYCQDYMLPQDPEERMTIDLFKHELADWSQGQKSG